jgi:hypothetical protein
MHARNARTVETLENECRDGVLILMVLARIEIDEMDE